MDIDKDGPGQNKGWISPGLASHKHRQRRRERERGIGIDLEQTDLGV